MAIESLHEIVLKNSPDQLVALSDWVEQLSNQLNLSPRCAFRMDLVLAEAVTNIIENAYVDDRDHDISVTINYHDDAATIQLKDDGIAFNPLQRPELVKPKCLEDASEGGLGIHLIRSYTDDCQYERLGCHNVLTFVIKNAE